MATYRRMLKDRAGNNIIPVTGLIEDYSTNEVDTGHTWIDGSHIYKKTINFGTLPNATAKTVAHGISNFNVLVKMDAMSYLGSTFMPLPQVYRGADSTYNVAIECTNTLIRMTCGQNRNSYSAYVTLYYTKTA